MLNHALTVGGDGTLDRVTTFDDAGGFISALTPSGNRSLWGAYVQDEISYNSWLRVLGALREDGYHLSGGGVSSGGTHLSPKLTIGITPIRGIEFYGTYAQGYHAPSVLEKSINVAQARLSGVELETGYDWGAGFATFEGSTINGKNLETGTSLATVPPYRASATLGFRFLDDHSLVAGVRFTAVGASPKNVPTATDGGGPLPTGGCGLVNLFASYAYNDRVSVNFSVNNLLNKEYTQFLNIEPNPGITVKAGLTIKFAEK
jgi:hemoglobin/transferrin/lactoferrin receptor protein